MQVIKRSIAPLIAIVIAIVVIGVVANRVVDNGDSGESKRTQPKLPPIGVGAKDFVAEFNKTSATDPLDFSIDEPRWVHDDAINLDVATYEISDWGLIELYRNSVNEITAVYVVAQPVGENQRALFLNIGTSVLTTVMHVERTAASAVLLKDLKAETVAGDLNEKVERFGLKFGLTYKSGAYQLTVTNATASGEKP